MTQEVNQVNTGSTDNVGNAGNANNSPAPNIDGSSAVQDTVLPMLDRSGLNNQNNHPNLGDALIEGQRNNAPSEQPNELNPDPKNNESLNEYETSSLQEMIGSELMQEPGASLVANSLIRLMGDVDHNRAFAKALEYGDPRFIDTVYLEEKLGKDVAQEAIKAAIYLSEYADNYADQMKEKLFSSVEGGEQAVQMAAKHFRSAASQEEQKAIAKMLDSGDTSIMQYAINQIMQYGQRIPQGSTNPQPRHSATQANLQPLTRAEFGKMVINNPNMSEQEYNALSARLRAGMPYR